MKRKAKMRRGREGIAGGDTNPLVAAFATRLKEWRGQHGWALKEVALEIAVSTSIICEWEHAHRFPSVDHLWAVARLTGIPACCLLYTGKGPCPAHRRKRSA
jgi:transcriptional regulator with XRE-family HTH domain